MLPIIDPDHVRFRELVCERFYLPETAPLPEIKAEVFPLEIEDASIIQSSHSYGEYTDLEYVTSRIKNGHHAGLKVNGELVAWAITHDDDGALGFLYVKPEYRGSGLRNDITTFMSLSIHRHILTFFHNDCPSSRVYGYLCQINVFQNRIIQSVKSKEPELSNQFAKMYVCYELRISESCFPNLTYHVNVESFKHRIDTDLVTMLHNVCKRNRFAIH
ncbi:MAG: GNAT family N-acetyltransferase [Bacillota bacterium]|nr:GNAT family N-acetyltransferase [Bacillota bacterium]